MSHDSQTTLEHKTPESNKSVHGYRYLGGMKETALITEIFSTYMKLLCRVSRGKTGEGDTGKRDYRHR